MTESVDKTRIHPRKLSTESVDSTRIAAKRAKQPLPTALTTTDSVLDTHREDAGDTLLRPRVASGAPTRIKTGNHAHDLRASDFSPAEDHAGTIHGRSSPEARIPLQSGALIRNRFRLVDRIGQGGMGVVFVARDLRKEEAGDEDSLVAIKLLNADLRRHPQAFRLLQQECKRSQGLAHPNIVTVYDFDRDGSTVYMTMQYLEGQTLKQLMGAQDEQGAELEAVMPVIQGISAGLAHAHAHGIVHSDLKPDNVMLTDSNEVKILDFGIARAMKAVESENRDQHVQELDDGIIGLTPRFASPEMFENASPDPRDDIFAFGCIVYQFLSGRHPFGCAANEVNPERQEPACIPGLDERQWNTLRRSLAFDRAERLGSAEEFLQGFLPPVRQRWRTVALILGICVVGISAFFFLRPPQPPDLFDNPLPEVVVTPEIESQISRMLELAEVHLMVGRAISPPGSNALDQYYQVLELQPYNRAAIDGLRQLLALLVGEAESALSDGDLERARMIVEIGLSINAKDSDMRRLEKALSE